MLIGPTSVLARDVRVRTGVDIGVALCKCGHSYGSGLLRGLSEQHPGQDGCGALLFPKNIWSGCPGKGCEP
ncbi:hypothetical protein EC604_06805 [Paenibacillus amylolyticus]|uniref:Uncharacterized protein n=1 Tax=Paenibacillus amylolyticus TaxID=1451 RepID=A0A5M9WPR6_PAEAM|nr:hypothetical protein [Paenibacillus amylolyticus]KAA8783552.1 hypothetical protein EC604_06805 [Paenibacillus amylolyticus]